MSVLAKFKCYEKTERISYIEDTVNVTVRLNGVMGEPFGGATPHAQCEMSICNKAAADAFMLGAKYEVTFKRVTSPKPEHPPKILDHPQA